MQVKVLDNFYRKMRNEILRYERGERYHNNLRKEVEAGFKLWKEFDVKYKIWLAETELDRPTHPWKQFLTKQELENPDILERFEKIK